MYMRQVFICLCDEFAKDDKTGVSLHGWTIFKGPEFEVAINADETTVIVGVTDSFDDPVLMFHYSESHEPVIWRIAIPPKYEVSLFLERVINAFTRAKLEQ